MSGTTLEWLVVLIFFLLFVLVGAIMLILFMMVMGPAGRGSDAPESAYIIGITLAFIIPPLLLFVIKRILLALLKIRSGSSAWVYSSVSTLLTFLLTLVPTGLFIYVISRR